MKCPRCGHEMTLDSHRKYPINMCYECGYMEGRNMGADFNGETNFQRLAKMNFNEAAAFISGGLGVDENKVSEWLDDVQ